MFTGLIQSTGIICRREKTTGGARYWVQSDWFSCNTFEIGASIAVNGVCLTIIDTVEHEANESVFDVSSETLEKTTLGQLQVGHRVNLESALTLSTPLGGHLVSGHIDGVGQFDGFIDEGEYKIARFRVPGELGRFIAHKGSVCIDGISLTSNAVRDEDGWTHFTVALVPHTLAITSLGALRAGDGVNIEVDVIARYTLRQRDFMHNFAGATDESSE